MNIQRFCFLCIILACTVLMAMTAGKRPMQPEDLYRIRGVSDPRISPDGRWVAFTVTVTDLAANTTDSDIWLVPLTGGEPRRLTTSPAGDHSPRWSPDGRQLAFISSREGTADLWLIEPAGGEARRLTRSNVDLSGPIWTPDGRHLLCTGRGVPAGVPLLENSFREELPLCEARTIHRLLYRQWDRWLGDERNQLWLVDPTDGSMTAMTPPEIDTPPVSLSSHHDYDIAPDGDQVCYVCNSDASGFASDPDQPDINPERAVSTNHDLFLVSLPAGDPVQLTTNPALDAQPHYSPDGRYLAYVAMSQPGYESDTSRLMLLDRQTGGTRSLSDQLDRSVDEIVWHPDSRRLFFTARDEGRSSIYTVAVATAVPERLIHEGYNTQLRISPDGETLICTRSYGHLPTELYVMPAVGGEGMPLTRMNDEWQAEVALSQLEEFRFTGAQNTEVHGFLLKPPRFEEGKTYPVVVTIHGGPQGMWADRFLTTWFTFPLVTSPGYIGVFINPRGSSGYGARFREEVSRDYGGRCFEDLMAGLDYVLANYPYTDHRRTAAIGGSFGGYSVNWIMGQTDRFSCLVSHAGLYNLSSFFGATEEIWYPAWDMGRSPWEEPELYQRWSPHRRADRFRTPTLITHGQLDFRVPVTESLQLFTALQLQGIPSRLLYFPDEGHVISTPQNNVRWWKEIHRWLAMYLQ
ncbi:MAG: S9 family peptidase [Acidobacteria bacterium]|nr:S9 family peptidase [Acidobacteriota bacterium]